MLKVSAYQIAENIDVKRFRKEFTAKDYFFNSSDIFYYDGDSRYLYVFSYGVVAFLGYSEVEKSELIDYIFSFSRNTLTDKISEEFIINENAREDRFGYNEIFLSQVNPDIIRIAMLNVGQSVALDYFSQLATSLLEETNKYTLKLERYGKLDITNKALLKFIGRTLNVKNRIIDNLYVIDSPEETWEHEYLNKIDSGLRNTFDLKIRFKEIDYQLQIVKENLDLFKETLQHRKSNLLEIIIIILILVEVINLFIEKIF
jgi:uncharacterized Rmd1/YagE family protein